MDSNQTKPEGDHDQTVPVETIFQQSTEAQAKDLEPKNKDEKTPGLGQSSCGEEKKETQSMDIEKPAGIESLIEPIKEVKHEEKSIEEVKHEFEETSGLGQSLEKKGTQSMDIEKPAEIESSIKEPIKEEKHEEKSIEEVKHGFEETSGLAQSSCEEEKKETQPMDIEKAAGIESLIKEPIKEEKQEEKSIEEVKHEEKGPENNVAVEEHLNTSPVSEEKKLNPDESQEEKSKEEVSNKPEEDKIPGNKDPLEEGKWNQEPQSNPIPQKIEGLSFSPEFLDFAKKHDEIHKILVSIGSEPDQRRNRALGCIAGAFLGDSIGSYLEFQQNPKEEWVTEAMTMPGGGAFNLKPGQITDDSELALCLAAGLLKGEGNLNLNRIVLKYAKWTKSYPFDMGNTIRGAFESLYLPKYWLDVDRLSKSVKQQASQVNRERQSNGGLMRLSPLAVWCNGLDFDEIERVVKLEVEHTHPNQNVIQACVFWVFAVVELIKSQENDAKRRMQLVYEKVEEYIDKKAGEEVKEWWNIVKNERFVEASHNMGWVRIAWTFSFIYLKQCETDYRKIMREVIARGGDTDTNACIVGGLIGSAIGLTQIPEEFLRKMIDCEADDEPQSRPKFYNPREGLIKGNKIFDLNVKPDYKVID